MLLFTQTALKKSSISAINERVDCMEQEKKEKKTFTEQLAEEMAKVPDDKKEVVAALLLGKKSRANRDAMVAGYTIVICCNKLLKVTHNANLSPLR